MSRLDEIVQQVRERNRQKEMKAKLVEVLGDHESEWYGFTLEEMVEYLERDINNNVIENTETLREAIEKAKYVL